MTDKLKTIRLYGKLGAAFGREHRLAVSSPAEAVRAMCALYPGFKAFLMQSKDKGMTFAVFRGKENINETQLHDPAGNSDIRIAPVLVGSKRGGILQTIVGVVLVVVGAYTTIFSAGTSSALVSMGWAMIIGGVSQMLFGVTAKSSSSDSAENAPNYNFNGTVNTQAQGNPVPIGYGKMLVGSAVISGGIYAEDQQ